MRPFLSYKCSLKHKYRLYRLVLDKSFHIITWNTFRRRCISAMLLYGDSSRVDKPYRAIRCEYMKWATWRYFYISSKHNELFHFWWRAYFMLSYRAYNVEPDYLYLKQCACSTWFLIGSGWPLLSIIQGITIVSTLAYYIKCADTISPLSIRFPEGEAKILINIYLQRIFSIMPFPNIFYFYFTYSTSSVLCQYYNRLNITPAA